MLTLKAILTFQLNCPKSVFCQPGVELETLVTRAPTPFDESNQHRFNQKTRFQKMRVSLLDARRGLLDLL